MYMYLSMKKKLKKKLLDFSTLVKVGTKWREGQRKTANLAALFYAMPLSLIIYLSLSLFS